MTTGGCDKYMCTVNRENKNRPIGDIVKELWEGIKGGGESHVRG